MKKISLLSAILFSIIVCQESDRPRLPSKTEYFLSHNQKNLDKIDNERRKIIQDEIKNFKILFNENLKFSYLNKTTEELITGWKFPNNRAQDAYRFFYLQS